MCISGVLFPDMDTVHAAQVVPVLQQLSQIIPALKVTIRTTVPISFFQNRLGIQWTYSASEQDIGCIQQGPLHIDIEKTWEAHAQFHEKWESRVETECKALISVSPDIILSDISYLAIEAGSRNKIPAVALASLTWDKVLRRLSDPNDLSQQTLMREIETTYRKADVVVQPFPALPFTAHPRIHPIGPILEKHTEARQELRKAVGALPEEHTVLIGFGGVSLDTLPFQTVEKLTGYRFIMSGSLPNGLTRWTSSSDIALPFHTLLASADIVMTKPGYSTIVDCVALSKPVVYVRRYNFADEEGLVGYLQQFGRGVELSIDDFGSGQWEQALQTARDLPPSPNLAPPAHGSPGGGGTHSSNLDSQSIIKNLGDMHFPAFNKYGRMPRSSRSDESLPSATVMNVEQYDRDHVQRQ